MKAVILEEKEKLVIKDIPKPICGSKEIIIQVKACNLCKTDLKCVVHGQRDLIYPRILGHEISGIIHEIGEEVQGFQRGAHVHIHPGIPCKKCDYCLQGLDNLCDHVKIMGFNFDGGFQEFLLIPEEGVNAGIINVMNNELSFEEISFIEPLSCCVNIQSQLDFSNSPTLLITGGGRLGLLNLILAKIQSKGKTILIDPLEERRNMALNLGCDFVYPSIDVIPKDLSIDIAIPCCPDPKALDQALKILKKRGQLGYFSGIINPQNTPIDINLIHYKEILICGSYGCSLNHSKEAKKLLEAKKIDLKPLISHRITLDEIEKGLDFVKNCDGFSTIIEL